MEEYNFTIEHISGKKNVAADALSRITLDDLRRIQLATAYAFPVTTRSMSRKLKEKQDMQERPKDSNEPAQEKFIPKVIEELNCAFMRKVPRVKCFNLTSFINQRNNIDCRPTLCAYKGHRKIMNVDLRDTVVNEKFSLEKILSKLQIQAIDKNLNKLQWPTDDEIFLHCSLHEFKEACESQLTKLRISLVKKPRRVESEEEKIELMTNFHNDPVFDGHFGQKKLYAKLRSNFYWKGMSGDVARFVKSCDECKVNKVRPSTTEPLVITPTPQKPFDIIIIDTCGPLPTSQNQNKYAVTMICDLTKYLVIAAIPNKEAKTVARAIFENFILTFGPMKQMKSDLGTEYKNEILRELCELLKIKQSFSTAY